MTQRNELDPYEDDLPPPRRVSVDEQRQMTGAPPAGMIRVVDRGQEYYMPRDDRAEVSRWDGAPLERVAGEIVRGVAEPPAVADAGHVWQRSSDSVSEVGTPVHRATATVIRAAPLIVLLFPATLALVWLLDVSGWWILPLWGGAAIAAYLAIVLMDLQHNSPSATERHRINRAAQVETLKAKQAHELRRTIVEAYLNHLDGRGRDS